MSDKKWTITADKFLSMEQVQALLAHIERERDLAIARGNCSQAIRDYYSVRILLESGLRVFEFCNFANFDFQGQKVIVRNGKGGKPRTVLLTRATSNLLKEWSSVKARLGIGALPEAPLCPSRFNRKYSTRGIQKRIKAIFAAVGLPSHLSAHSLRHTYCSLLLSTGKVPITTVRDNLGHHSLTVTNLYAHAVADISGVELYASSSSEKDELSEPGTHRVEKKANGFVKSYLRNVNLKAPVLNR